ncbi:MAG TPA: ribonuclease P protein component, partial [Acidimicrobiales bacterium]|nr:ribonuclease P protein component [Acidimicrobiales bacterium]
AVAVTKASGGAVARNRIRRRLRAAAAELLRAGRLPSGTYLISAGPEAARTPWVELVAALDEAVAATAAGSA